MAHYTLLIDLQRCIGCYSCNVACKQENGVPPGQNWNEVFTVGPVGEFPNVQAYFLPRPCMHCDNPACVAVCPTGASYKRPDGPVLVNHDICIGCQYCTWACPYGARVFNTERMVTEKCTMCAHLIDAGQKPQCVAHCMGQARFFGDIDDPNSDISKYLAANKDRATHLLEEQGTKPSVIYLKPKVGMLSGTALRRSG